MFVPTRRGNVCAHDYLPRVCGDADGIAAATSRHCERSEAIQSPSAAAAWIASLRSQ